MPTSISQSYHSPVIFTDAAMRFLRFQVMQTVGKRDDSHIFAMSEFQIHEAEIDEDASPYFLSPTVKEAFDALQTELQRVRPLIVADNFTSEDKTSLRQAIERAEEALRSADGLTAVRASKDIGPDVIYNLNGQRVGKPGKGIYIVNGKKVLMK